MSEALRSHEGNNDTVSENIREFFRGHGGITRRLDEEIYLISAAYIDDITEVMSGGFASTFDYQLLLNEGPRVMPFLMDDLDKPGVWWRLEMICFFASEIFEMPIEFPEEIRGRLEPVVAHVQEWWEQTGQDRYLEFEPVYREFELPTPPRQGVNVVES